MLLADELAGRGAAEVRSCRTARAELGAALSSVERIDGHFSALVVYLDSEAIGEQLLEQVVRLLLAERDVPSDFALTS